MDVTDPFVRRVILLPGLWFDEHVDGLFFVEGVPEVTSLGQKSLFLCCEGVGGVG